MVQSVCKESPEKCESFPRVLEERLAKLGATDVLDCLNGYTQTLDSAALNACLMKVEDTRGYLDRIRGQYTRNHMKWADWGVVLMFPPGLAATIIYSVFVPVIAGVESSVNNDSSVLDLLKDVGSPELLKQMHARLASLKTTIRDRVLGKYVNEVRPRLISQGTLSLGDRLNIDRVIHDNLQNGTWVENVGFSFSTDQKDLRDLVQRIRKEALKNISEEIDEIVPLPLPRPSTR